MDFIDWGGRPAVLREREGEGGDAYAILAPGEGWTRVDRLDVAHTGAVKTEAAWRRRLAHFELIDLSTVPPFTPSYRRAAE